MIKRILISLIGLIFTVSAVTTIFMSEFYKTLSSENFYKETLTEKGYETTTTYIQNLIKEEIEHIPEEEILETIKRNISKEDLSLFLTNLYKGIFELEMKEGELSIEISLAPLLEKKEPIFKDLANYTWENLPKCETQGQENCIPPNLPKEDFKSRTITSLNNNLFDEIPKTLVFNILIESDYEGKLTDYLAEITQMVFSIARAFLLLFLVLIALIVMYPWYEILKTELKIISYTCLALIIMGVSLIFLPNSSLENLPTGGEKLLLTGLSIAAKETAGTILMLSGIIFLLTIGGIIALKAYSKTK